MKVQKTNSRTTRATEEMLNVPLPPDVKRDLGRISLYNGRTQRRQAAIYVARCVASDIRRLVSRIGQR